MYMWKDRAFSIAAIVLSIVAIGLAIIRTTPFVFENTDFYGWVLAGLSLLVAILIGWQIYSYISVEQRANKILDEISKKYADLDSKNYDLMNSVDLKFKELEAVSVSQQGMNFYAIGKYKESIRFMIHALNCYKSMNNNENVNSAISQLEIVINESKAKGYEINIDEQTKENWLSALLSVQNINNRKQVECIMKNIGL